MASNADIATTTSPAVREPKLITVSPGRPQYPTRAMEAFGISPGDWRALVDAIFPAAETTEAVELALSYCRARNLDIFKRPVHIVPIYSKAKKGYVESLWPGIGELRTTAARTNQWAGCDESVFGPDESRTFRGVTGKDSYAKTVEKTVTFPAWCQITVYRLLGGQRVPFPGPKVWWTETYSSVGATDVPNDMWEARPRGQLEKCAEAAALRRAFPEEVGSDYIMEEAGRSRGPETIDITPTAPGAKTAGLAQKLAARTAAAVVTSPVDETTEERDSGAGAATTTPPADGVRLSPAVVAELRDLLTRTGVRSEDLEERYGCSLADISLPGVSTKELEAELIREIRQMAADAKAKGTEEQLPLGAG